MLVLIVAFFCLRKKPKSSIIVWIYVEVIKVFKAVLVADYNFAFVGWLAGVGDVKATVLDGRNRE